LAAFSAAERLPCIADDPPVYDLKGLKCPLPVLRAKKRLDRMPDGARIWIETTDPLASIDIPAFCADSGHKLVETVRIDGGHRFLIESTSRQTPARTGG
jgi:tRNA 2-thiouridine synthesizing protein A